YHRNRNHSAASRQLLRYALSHWYRLGFSDPTDDAMEAYRDIRIEEGYARDTVRGEMAKLIAVAKWLGHNPVVKIPRGVQRAPLAWSRSQVRALFNAAYSTELVVWGVPGKVFWPAL